MYFLVQMSTEDNPRLHNEKYNFPGLLVNVFFPL